MYQELDKYIIPDLAKIVMEFVSGSKDNWRKEMNKSIEQFKTRRLNIDLFGKDNYLENEETGEKIELILLFKTYDEMKEIKSVNHLDVFQDDETELSEVAFEYNKFFYCTLGKSINKIKKGFLRKLELICDFCDEEIALNNIICSKCENKYIII